MSRRNPNDLTGRNNDAQKKRHAILLARVKRTEAAQRGLLAVVKQMGRVLTRVVQAL